MKFIVLQFGRKFLFREGKAEKGEHFSTVDLEKENSGYLVR